MINLKRYVIFLLVLCSAIGYAQSFSSPTKIPANGNVTVNGVTITTASTGDANNSISANPKTPCLPSVTSPELTTVPGQLRVGSSAGVPSASTAWSVTLNFSSPVNNVVFSITAVDGAENFIFNSNGGPVSLSHNSCYMNVTGNQAVTNGVTGGSVTDVTGGFFQASSPFPYTQLTINGNGGGFGSVILLSGGSVSYSGTIDSDGDGKPDVSDLDDDNDGILDTTENPCTSAQVQWMHNASSGQSDFATFGNDTTTTSPHFTSANNISFGTGLNETTDNYPYTYLLRNATATTFADAKTGNDYAQVSYTPSKKMYLNGINFGYFSSTGSPQFNCGNFKMAVEYSTSAAFTSPIVLLQDIQVGAMVSGGYTTVNNAISKLLLQSGTTYYFRVYFYDEQNTDPNNRVRLDDLYFPHCLFVDTDNDQTEDYLDLDSDGDGCSDANEYYNSATADGGDGGVYGTGTPSVDANGQVIGASYTGIYTNAVTATQSSIVTQPINITQEVGLNAVFTVDADAISTTTFTSGTPNFAIPPATDSSASLIYQWQESIDGGTTWTNISNGGQYSGATTNTLTVSNITLVQDQNQYQVLVSHATNPCSILSSVSTLTITISPAIVITKEGTYVDTNADGITNIGDVISYVFTVENTGNTVLTNITVTDPNAVVTGGPLASLAVGATDTTTFTATHVITQADIDAGFVYNLATATGNDPNGDPVTDTSSDPTPCATCPVDPTCPECTIVELTQSPAIVITKEGTYVDTNADGITNIGDVISYVFTVENTGNTVLTNITVTDPNAVVTGGPLASLAVGATDTTTFTATHVITQADIDAGFIYNLATATGNDPNGDPVTDTSSDPTPCATCPVDPTCPECTIVELTQSPAIVITKEGTYVDTNADGITNIGDVISYVFTVENTGNTVLTNITVTDPNAVVTGGPLASLAVGATDTTTFTATHVITQADIDAGFIYNLATATGNDPNGDPVTDTSSDPTPCATCPVDPTCPECTIVELTQSPAIVITKEGTYVDTNADGITNIGDVISYVFTVENTGNTVLTNITVTDPNAVVTGGPLASLAVGATDTTTFTATHVITQADIDAGFIYNLATATGNDPNGDPVTDTSSDPTPCATCPVDPTCPECTIVELTQSPAIVITKEGTYVDTNADGITNIGDVISYVFTVENTGNTVLTNITVTDPNAVVTGGPLASLAVGATDTTTFTATHVITQADIDAGFIYNLATATGNDPNGDPVTDTSSDPTPCATCPVDPTCPECTIVELTQSPAIVITKEGTYVDTNADGITNIGDVISYVFTVENTGNTVLTNITVTDPNAVVTGGPLASLAVGATDTTTFTATHVITQADIDAGFIYNLATATGNDPNGDPVTDTSSDPTPCATCPVDPTCPECTIVELTQSPAIVITKEGTYVDTNADGITNIGDVISYVFTVENTGNTVLTNITVTDPNAVVTGGPLASLAVGATDTTTFTATHVITQADIDAGFIYNLATATGNDPNGDPVTDTSSDPTPCATCPVDPTCPECTIVELTQSPAIVITKEGTYVDTNADGITNIGDVISYVFTVENTGNTVLTNITVTDPNAVVTGGPLASLAVGATDTTTFTATHVITQADIDAGFIYNLATATGNDPNGDPVTDTSSDPTPCATCPVDPTCPECTIVELTQSPAIQITKEGTYVDTNADGITNIGDVISYVFTVENTGNTVLTNITVTDPNAVVTGGPLASLAVGATETTTFTATHVITQADIDAGFVYNLATATGNDPNGDPVTDTSSDPTPCATCPVDPTCPECTIVELTQSPAIQITKEGTYVDTNADGITNIGDVISYVFTVENTGNTVLTNITVTDPNAVVTGGPLASLAVGATDTTTFTATHVITQADIDAGYVYNLATATGNDPNGDPVTDESEDPTPCTTCPVDPTCPDCTIVEVEQEPAIVITKDGTYVDSNGNGVANVGDVINYVFTVQNTGNVTLTNVTVADINAVVTGGPLASLAVGATDSTTFTATHVLTQADIDAGYVYNLATATGNDPNGDPVTDESEDPTPCTTCPVDPTCPDCTIVEVEQEPAIVITKDGTYVDSNGNGVANVGDVINYVFTVQNTGNVTLTNVTVADINAVVTGGPLASLAVGATDSTTFTATHVLTQADIDAGYVYNLATATGNDPNGDPVTDESEDPTPCTTCPVDPTCPDCTIVEVEQEPAIVITKDGTYVDSNGNGVANVGDVINYVFTVQNTGNVTLTNVTVADINAVVTGGPLASLAVGATDSTTFTATHVLTQADIDAGYVYNLATATGNDPNGDPVTDESEDPTPCTTCPVDPTCPDCTIVEVEQEPAIAIVKEATFNDNNGDGFPQAGETITYTFTVTNTGNMSLFDVIVTDPLPGIVLTGGPIDLAVGQSDSTTFTATYTITQADIVFGSVVNQATASAETIDGEVVDDLSDDDSELEDDPTIVILEGCKLTIFNAVSPNGDGSNDIFYIQGIECYPNNTVEVYNRWGIKVYEVNNYDNISNVFKGYSDGRVTISRNELLPTGTYFYIIKYVDLNGNGIDKSGYLYIQNN